MEQSSPCPPLTNSPTHSLSHFPPPSPSLIVSDLASPPSNPPLAPAPPQEPAPSLPTSGIGPGTLASFADRSKIANPNSKIEPPARKHARGRVSKVSLLPDSVREWVNESLLRNIPYYIM